MAGWCAASQYFPETPFHPQGGPTRAAPRFADALRLNQVSLRKTLLISTVVGLAALIAILGLSQIEAVEPAPIVLLLPGLFVAAKIGDAPS